ncbi:MAG: LysR family transcriptional regulator [Gammaproteobacteria bacterium]|nr:LysR family transcriptional regulator [Gammaproteobacteria bacterium]
MLQQAIIAAREGSSDALLRISALPLFTGTWLIPRLERFDKVCAEANLKFSIQIDTSSTLTDFETSRVDIAIRNLHRPDTRLYSRKLLDLSTVPMCAPALAKRLKSPVDLAQTNLIHISGRAEGWNRWLAAIGVEPIQAKADLSFDTIPAALDAAVAGRGVMLGLDPLIWDAPAASRLVIPFKTKRVSAGSYFLVCRHSDRTRRAVRLFGDWLVEELRGDARRLATASKAARSSVG